MFGILTPPPNLYLKNYNKRKVKMQTLMEKGDKKLSGNGKNKG